ncbi:MAG: hypothetical protein ABJ359_09075 [Nitratireductor sp.]
MKEWVTTASRILTAILALSPVAGGPALAQTGAPGPSLTLELNAIEPGDGVCRFTFVIANRLGAALDKAAFEIVLFDKAGLVDRLVTLDFKALPQGKTKVRQFDLPGVDCEGIGRVLVNDATRCEGAGVDATACLRTLEPATRTAIEFGV